MRARRRPHGQRGFTLLEVVVVVAVLGLSLGTGLVLTRPSGAFRAAGATRAFLRWARSEAIWTGSAVAVVPAGQRELAARAGGDGAPTEACQGSEVKRLDLARFGRVRYTRVLRAGIVWLPGGGARSCDGGGVISDTITVSDASRTVRVIVSSLGRVRVEVPR